MKMSGKVSVLLCGYNQAQFLREGIESILNQTYDNFELIAIDNGSTDGSAEVLKAYANHPKVRLVLHESNGTVTSRLNHAFSLSSGEFISIIYADDLYLPTKLEKQMKAFEGLGPEYGVVYSPGYRLNVHTGEQWRERILGLSGSILRPMLERLLEGGVMHPISPLVRRECFMRYPFRTDMFTEGETHYFRLAISYQFFFVDEPLVIMRDHESNIGKALKRNMKDSQFALQKLTEETEFPVALTGTVALCRGKLLANYAWQGIRVMEDPRWARECLSLAAKQHLPSLLHWKSMFTLLMSLFPQSMIRQLNQIGHRLSGQKTVLAYRDGYS